MPHPRAERFGVAPAPARSCATRAIYIRGEVHLGECSEGIDDSAARISVFNEHSVGNAWPQHVAPMGPGDMQAVADVDVGSSDTVEPLSPPWARSRSVV